MADEFKKAFDIDVELVPGEKGIFDVVADGRLVFSRFKEGRFPEPGEVVKKLK